MYAFKEKQYLYQYYRKSEFFVFKMMVKIKSDAVFAVFAVCDQGLK
jgi:hypothetical protein